MITLNRLAAYLEQASADPTSASALLHKHQVRHVCLRHAWGTPIEQLSDQALQQLKHLLQQHDLQPLMLHSALQPTAISDALLRPFLLANYLGCSAIRLGNAVEPAQLQPWLAWGQEQAIIHQLTPVLGASGACPQRELLQLLRQYPEWRLDYDPNLLLPDSWDRLHAWVMGIRLHDRLAGHGVVPPGHGDAGILELLHQARQRDYAGWFLLDHGLGQRYGTAVSQEGTFELVMEAVGQLIHAQE